LARFLMYSATELTNVSSEGMEALATTLVDDEYHKSAPVTYHISSFIF